MPQLNQRGPSHEESKHVGHHVVHDDHHDGQDVPDQPLEQVLRKMESTHK